MASTTNTTKVAERVAGRMATAQAKVDAIQVELEAAAVAMREDGCSYGEIAAAVGMSRPGVLKLLRRNGAA